MCNLTVATTPPGIYLNLELRAAAKGKGAVRLCRKGVGSACQTKSTRLISRGVGLKFSMARSLEELTAK